MALPEHPETDPQHSRYVELGRFGKSHALEGEVRFFCHRALESLLNEGSLVYIRQKNQVVPLRVLSVRRAPGKLTEKREVLFFVKLDRIQNREEADLLRDQLLFIQKSPDVTTLLKEAEKFDNKGYEGFTLYNRETPFGLIKEVLETAAHPVLCVDTGGREVLIPYTTPFIVRQDKDQKILYGMDLELFLEL